MSRVLITGSAEGLGLMAARLLADDGHSVTTLQRYSLLGADVNYVHGNMLTDREFDLIAGTQGTVTITPSTTC